MPINDISYKRNDEYISLIYKNNPSKCICKLYLNEPQNYVLIPTDGVIEERIDISNIYELAKKKKYFIQSLKRYLNPLFNFDNNSKWYYWIYSNLLHYGKFPSRSGAVFYYTDRIQIHITVFRSNCERNSYAQILNISYNLPRLSGDFFCTFFPPFFPLSGRPKRFLSTLALYIVLFKKSIVSDEKSIFADEKSIFSYFCNFCN